MLSNKLIEYLKSTNEAKQALDPNSRKQYDFQIRAKVAEAISHLSLLLSSHSEEQLKKIFSGDRILELLKTVNKASKLTDKTPDKAEEFLELIRNIEKDYLSASESKAHDNLERLASHLMERGASGYYEGIVSHILFLKNQLCSVEDRLLLEFLKEKKLQREYETWKRQKLYDVTEAEVKKD